MRQPISKTTRRSGGLLLAILLGGVFGCGKTATVSGKVSYQGRPVTHGSVTLLSADRTARSGVIAPDGSYAVERVPTGTVKIAVISRDPAKGRSAVPGQKLARADKKGTAPQDAAARGWFPLPQKFESVETSGLDCTVDSGRVSHDLELK